MDSALFRRLNLFYCLAFVHASAQPALTYLNSLNHKNSPAETYASNIHTGPMLNRAGNKMVFEQDSRTYFTTKNKDGTWKKPVEIQGVGARHSLGGVAGFDGKRLYFKQGGVHIRYIELQDDGFWSQPVDAFDPVMQLKQGAFSQDLAGEAMTITSDGGLIVFSTKAKPADKLFLVYAFRDPSSSKWQYKPTQKVNQYPAKEEFRPLLLSDGRTLLYNAAWDEWKDGKVERVEKQYVTRLLDDGVWSLPQPTGGEKYYYTWASVNMDTAYFRTTYGRVGYAVDPEGVIFKRPVVATRAEPAVTPQSTTTIETPVPASGRYHALLIGVSDYADDKLDLAKPVEDLAAMKALLSKHYTFDEKDIITLTNPDRQAIIKELFKLRSSIGPRDNLLIFYAGHGYWDKTIMQGYWFPSNASTTDPSNWLSNSDLREQIRGINSAHTLLISDACFSGGIFRTRGAENIQNAPLEIKMLYKMKSRRAITSGTLSSVPDESVFLQYMMKRLTENQEEFLPSQSLFSSVRLAVINNSLTVPQDGVISEAGDEGGDFIFIRRVAGKP